MDRLNQMRMQITSEFATMNEESLILIMGGASQQLSATGSCGSTGSSNNCDKTAVCNCVCPPPPIKKPTSSTLIV